MLGSFNVELRSNLNNPPHTTSSSSHPPLYLSFQKVPICYSPQGIRVLRQSQSSAASWRLRHTRSCPSWGPSASEHAHKCGVLGELDWGQGLVVCVHAFVLPKSWTHPKGESIRAYVHSYTPCMCLSKQNNPAHRSARQTPSLIFTSLFIIAQKRMPSPHLHEAPREELPQGDAQQQRGHLISHLLRLLTHLRAETTKAGGEWDGVRRACRRHSKKP